ncbi:MAG: DUF1344 domain-containing protein [Pseudomonadota bacterium]
MKKFLAPVAALTFALSISAAQADDASGKIAAVDAAQGTIILEDGTAFTVVEGLPMEGLQPGTDVTVSYEEQDGQLIATEVVPSN